MLSLQGLKKVLWASLVTTLVVVAGCSNGSQDTSDGELVFAESEECRESTQPFYEALEYLEEHIGDDGVADLDVIEEEEVQGVEFLDPLGAWGAPMLVEPFALHCSKELRDLRADVDLAFSQASLMWGNDCFMEKASCDEQFMWSWLLKGLEAGEVFSDAVERKVDEDEAEKIAQPAGTVNLTGELSLSDAFETFEDEGVLRCYGSGDYDDVHGGAQITVTDADGRKVALGELATGYVPMAIGSSVKNTGCRFRIDIEAVPDQPGVLSIDIGGFTGPDITVQKYKNESSTLMLFLNF